jgi:hypothetical protein
MELALFQIQGSLAQAGQLMVMGHDNEGRVEAFGELKHQIEHLFGRCTVQVASGFIGQHTRWVRHQSTRHGNSLALSPGELRGAVLSTVLKTQAL